MPKNMIPVSETKPKRRGPDPTGKNLPNSRGGFGQSEEDRSLITQLLSESLEAYKMPKVRSDEQLAERLMEYFDDRATRGIIPTIEEMYLYTGYGVGYMQDIESGRRKGFSDSTAGLLKKAKEFLQNFDGKLVMTGKLNFLAYCFRAKNYYGMSDKTEIQVTPTVAATDFNREEIAQRYMEDSTTLAEVIDSDDSTTLTPKP